ncbi:MAG: cell envelope integrity protein CreD [Bacteroidota bacterium]
MKFIPLLTLFLYWLYTSLLSVTGFYIYILFLLNNFSLGLCLFVLVITMIASLPGFLFLWICTYFIQRSFQTAQKKINQFLILLYSTAFLYGIIAGLIASTASFSAADFLTIIIVTCIILIATFITSRILIRKTAESLSVSGLEKYTSAQIFSFIFSSTHKKTIMEITEQQPEPAKSSNNYLLKGFITGFLILLMMIPTIFIDNLVTERQNLQQEVVREVSSKWASAQTLSGPFLVVPYNYSVTNNDGKIVPAKKNIIMLPENLHVVGNITPEERKRSIYTVLLYKSDLNFKGNFNINITEDIIPENLDFKTARICFSLSDFKGIEEEMLLQFNGETVHFSPGLPVADFGKTGLSAPVQFDSSLLNAPITFELNMKLKGSSQLHFMPLSANSSYQLTSAWPHPSFDGNTLPDKHSVSENGFSANWDFNQANLPFGTVMSENDITKFETPQNNQVQYDTPQRNADKNEEVQNDLSFGVSLVQPADQYDQTLRCVKYAILIIGLSFAFFFIIEIMQKKPFHPVQYVLVGIALVIFYSLLLSLSEYILFDYAYLIAALATVLLISLYVKAHFKSWKTAGIFFGLLSCLYACIFILIRLVDTALIVGSIGLFVILAIVMFASRKINWYGNPGKIAYE